MSGRQGQGNPGTLQLPSLPPGAGKPPLASETLLGLMVGWEGAKGRVSREVEVPSSQSLVPLQVPKDNKKHQSTPGSKKQPLPRAVPLPHEVEKHSGAGWD